MSQPTQDTNPDAVNLTLTHINKLLIGVNLAQSRGAYTFDDSVELADTVKLVTKFIKYNNEQAEKNAKEQAQQQSQAPPSQAPPSQAPPSQAPPTQAPPTQAQAQAPAQPPMPFTPS